jgi:hypothetical protein
VPPASSRCTPCLPPSAPSATPRAPPCRPCYPGPREQDSGCVFPYHQQHVSDEPTTVSSRVAMQRARDLPAPLRGRTAGRRRRPAACRRRSSCRTMTTSCQAINI